MSTGKTLLAIFAHPDDETFGIGGTLAYYARRGVDVYLICATRGEAGVLDPTYRGSHTSIGELREHELACAAQTLGIREVIYLDYRDSGMAGSPDNQHPHSLASVPLAKLVEEIIAIMERIQPQVVITFDPIGGYFHIDHIKIHQAAKQAFFDLQKKAGADKPQKLYYYTIAKKVMRLLVRLMPLFGKDPSRYGQNKDIDLSVIAANDFPIHARINYSSVKDVRQAASDCYASQGGGNRNLGAAGLLRGWSGNVEVFSQAYPDSTAGQIETDLFLGVK